MIITFVKKYLQELYVNGQTNDKKHRFQPQIVNKFIKVINLMEQQENVLKLTKFGSLHYEKLKGEKKVYPLCVSTTNIASSSAKQWKKANRLPRYVTLPTYQNIIINRRDIL